jgi:drug/metabolite transporter (DMT)-like permease
MMQHLNQWFRPSPAVKAAVASLGALQLLVIGVILVLNQFFNVGATLSFAASGNAERVRTFIIWQIIGGFFGLGVNLTFAGLVRYWSLSFANATGIGLAFVSAQVFAAYMILHEPFAWPQWLGTALVFVGVVLIATGPR